MIQTPQLPMFRDPDTSDASLVAGWHFPGVRGTPHDVGGTHDGASTALTFLRTAGDYNGTTSVIRVADHADLRVTNNLTIRGWGTLSQWRSGSDDFATRPRNASNLMV